MSVLSFFPKTIIVWILAVLVFVCSVVVYSAITFSPDGDPDWVGPKTTDQNISVQLDESYTDMKCIKDARTPPEIEERGKGQNRTIGLGDDPPSPPPPPPPSGRSSGRGG